MNDRAAAAVIPLFPLQSRICSSAAFCGLIAESLHHQTAPAEKSKLGGDIITKDLLLRTHQSSLTLVEEQSGGAGGCDHLSAAVALSDVSSCTFLQMHSK